MDSQTDTLFHYFADPSRRSLLRLLGECPLSVGEIAQVMRLPQSTVSRHLKALRSTGLLAKRRDGTRTISSLVRPADNGNTEISHVLNQWLRKQTLSEEIRMRLNQVLSGRQQMDAFSRLAHQWDALRQTYFGSQFHLEALLALLPRHWHVLDLGTGTGYLLPALSRHFRRVTAVDASEAMLGLASHRIREMDLPNVTLRHGTLESLDIADQSVDVVLAILVLHHVADLATTIGEAQRVTRDSGRILIVEIAPHQMHDFQRLMGDPVAGIAASRIETALAEAGWRLDIQRPLTRETSREESVPNLYLIRGSKTTQPRIAGSKKEN